jgi:hypothetical protein
LTAHIRLRPFIKNATMAPIKKTTNRIFAMLAEPAAIPPSQEPRQSKQ